MKRTADVCLSIAALLVFGPLMLLIAGAILTLDGAPILYWSTRIGRGNIPFRMPKFRTMRRDTPAVATHLLHEAGRVLTPLGRLLRKWSLDELPQFWSVLRGQMSVVGPRPALFNQLDLIEARTRVGVSNLVPGLTGLAQISGRDELTIADKVERDLEYLRTRGFCVDARILWLTVIKVVRRDGVSH